MAIDFKAIKIPVPKKFYYSIKKTIKEINNKGHVWWVREGSSPVVELLVHYWAGPRPLSYCAPY